MITYTILIVDDDPDDIEILRSAFHEIGAREIQGVLSMPQALDHLQSIEDINDLPKLIITDLNMPGQNGYELLRFLKASPRYRHIPVIVCSTSVSCKEKETSLSLGAIDYIPKPVLVVDYKNLAAKMVARINIDV